MKKLIVVLLIAVCVLPKVNDMRGIMDFSFFSEESTVESNESVMDKLHSMARDDHRVWEIIENKDKYPEILLKMLSRNPDMIEYVLDYPTKKGNVYADSIGHVTKGDFPLLLQYDEKWGFGEYGNSVIAINGCGPTVISMAVAGLTGRNDVTPYKVAQYAYQNGYYQESGTSWSMMTEGVNKYGIQGKVLPLSETIMMNELEQGHPIVCSMGPGHFTTTGHFILITGTKNGQFIVNDSNSSERSHQLWSYDDIESQIKNLWSFSHK